MNHFSQSSPEAALLLAVLREPVDQRIVDRCVSDVVKWQEFVDLCQRHQVTSLVAKKIEACCRNNIPNKVLRRLQVLNTMIEHKNQMFAGELIQLHTAFESAGIDVLHYKGASASQLLYGDTGTRQFGDIDFLFAEERTADLLGVLAQCGYEDQRRRPDQPDYLYQFEKDFVLCKGPFIVEPHWSLTARRISIDIDYSGLWARSQSMSFGSETIRTFSPVDMLYVMSICGAKAQWQRLQMITDIAQIIRRYPQLDWQQCFARAERSGCARMMRVGLFAAIDWLDTSVPQHVEDWVLRDRKLPYLLDSMCNVLALDNTDEVWGSAGPASFNRFMFALHEGVKNKTVYLFRSATSPSALHIQRFPLPSFLRWLYRLVVPFHDYAAVPIARKFRGWVGGSS